MMKNIDTVILAILVFLVIKGIWRGFVKEFISLFAYMAAFLTASSQAQTGTIFFQKTMDFHPILGYLTTYFLFFFGVMFIIKFFAKRIKKLVNKEVESGLIDSIGGGVFGFLVGMTLVSVMVTMITPIPIANQILEQKDRSLFIPLAEKYAKPIAKVYIDETTQNNPLADLLAQSPDDPNGGGMLPDMMKNLLGEGMGGGLMDAINFKKNLDAVGSGGINLDALQSQVGGAGGNSQPLDGMSQAMKALGVDTASIKKINTKDLMKLLEKK